MYKVTNKQQKEVEFFKLYKKIDNFEDWEIEEYFECTVHGKPLKYSSSKGSRYSNNKLFQAKRSLDIMLKQQRIDIKEGICFKEDFDEDGWSKNEYFQKILKQLFR